MPRSIEVVSHCWNYSRLLALQLSGFATAPPERHELTATVFYCDEDRDTVGVLDFFLSLQVERVRWRFLPLERRYLLRRAIGRNNAALSTAADVLVFTDCDYVYLDGAVDAIGDAVLSAGRPVLAYIRGHQASESHEAGDAVIESVAGPGIAKLDTSMFSESRLARAIGGSQIVAGDWARAHGYIPRHARYHRPASEWKRTFEDAVFRRASGLPSLPIDCQSVYRVRHSKRGRFDIGVKL